MTRYPSLITGHWSLVFCHRSLVTGHRLAKRAALIASLIATPAPAADLPTLWAEARRVQEAEAARPPDAGPFAPFRPGPGFPATARAGTGPARDPPAAEDRRRRYDIPLYSIAVFNVLLHGFNRLMFGGDFDTDLSTIGDNLRARWQEDRSTFAVNQLGHPYQGGIYHGFARSAGLGYWASLPYVAAGSAMWEIAGETTPPSRSDLITTLLAGSFVGEALFRMAHLVLERGTALSPEWREAAAAALSPSAAVHRHLLGDQLDGRFSSRGAPYSGALLAGAGASREEEPGSAQRDRAEALLDFSFDYGLPGRPAYRYRRPFDLFSVRIAASTASRVERLSTYGLLAGLPYAGTRSAGVWGLYGSYDYFGAEALRAANSALALGTSWQLALRDRLKLQGTVLAGGGYASAGAAGALDDRDNRFGFAPQALVALRLLFGRRAALELSALQIDLDQLDAAPGRDRLRHAEATLTYRLLRRHAVALRVSRTERDIGAPQAGAAVTREWLGLYYRVAAFGGS